MFQVINIVDAVYDNKRHVRDFDKINMFMVHRCGVDLEMNTVLGYDGVSVSEAFRNGAASYATGGQIAYTFLIGGGLGRDEYNGKIWQCLPMGEVGFHARQFSVKALGIGLIGDFRFQGPTIAQMMSLHDLLAALCVGWAKDPYTTIKGHGEVKGAHDGSKAKGKPAACPGDLLNMDHVRDDVTNLIRSKARMDLDRAGVVF